MNGKKVGVILCVFSALCAIMYLVPSLHTPGELPKAATSTIMKQRARNTGEPPKTPMAKPQKLRVSNSPQTDNTTSDSRQSSETVRTIARPTPTTTDENASPTAQDQRTQDLEKRMQEFKEKYQWDEPATMNLSEHLINLIPVQFRDSGITAMIKNLDEAQQQGGSRAVDELMVLQSVEKIMPEEFKPQLQEIIAKYKADQPLNRR